MHLKKLSAIVLVFLIIGLFVFTSVHAEKKPVVTATTHSVVPLRIAFEPDSEDRIFGEVTGRYTSNDIEKIKFTVAGDFDLDGDIEKHEARFDWEERYRENGSVYLSFNFNLSYIGRAGRILFMSDLLNTDGNTIAKGSRLVNIRRLIH